MNLNATLFAQLVVFFILAWFTMKFVWPPIMKALDERAKKIADGLSAADKAKSDLALAEKKVVDELKKARESATELRAGAEKQGAQLIEEARQDASAIPACCRRRSRSCSSTSSDRSLPNSRTSSACSSTTSACRFSPRSATFTSN